MCISIKEISQLRDIAAAILKFTNQPPSIQAIAIEMAQIACDPEGDQDEQEHALMVMSEALFPVSPIDLEGWLVDNESDLAAKQVER